METMWNMEASPAERLIDEALRASVDRLLKNKAYLAQLRYRNDIVKQYLRTCGYIFAEKKIDLYEKITEASHATFSKII
jgi:hypothetical protein